MPGDWLCRTANRCICIYITVTQNEGNCKCFNFLIQLYDIELCATDSELEIMAFGAKEAKTTAPHVAQQPNQGAHTEATAFCKIYVDFMPSNRIRSNLYIDIEQGALRPFTINRCGVVKVRKKKQTEKRIWCIFRWLANTTFIGIPWFNFPSF